MNSSSFSFGSFASSVSTRTTTPRFYREKFDQAGIDPAEIDSFEDVRKVPTTAKVELRGAQQTEPFPYGEVLAADPTAVTEYHQTSGTTGEPVRQADSWRDWEWWGDCWATVLWAQGIRPDDRVFFPFSYNVFVAFWAAHYACERIGAEAVPGGNLSSAQRVRKMDELDVTAFMSTPTYALRLAEVAEEEGFDPSALAIERIVCAGEPGASVPGTKQRLEERWDARVFDHAGATESGAWGFSAESTDELGLYLNEASFLIEVLDGNDESVGQAADAYKVCIDEHETKDIDTITLVTEVAESTNLSREQITSELRKELKQTTNLRFRIDLREQGSLDRPELKADRLTDRRNHD
jgi:phenylacetate-CoA ligase